MSEQKICPTCGTEYPLSERFCPRDGTALRSASTQADLLGSIVADRYHIIRKLGEGGMGTVYLAEHVKMGRKSALKVMNPGMNTDPDAIARFNREASNASRLSHPNICGIYDFGETPDGLIYLAMEFIEGSSLTALIEKDGSLPAARCGSIIHQTADALQVAHDAGIVHRDLKPDNIMIARARDGADHVKVVDFGIAKASSSDAQKVTRTGLVVGTPEYMSPEQLAGDTLDGRSDIYSLGLVAFNCLTGKLPFPAETSQEAMIMRLTDRPRTLAETRRDITWTAELQRTLDKALERDASARYQSAAEFGREFAAAIAAMPATRAIEAGTLVMGAETAGASSAGAGMAGAGLADRADVPLTRQARASGKTVPMEAVGASPAAAPDRAGARRPAAAPAQKKSAMPMLLGGGLVAAALAAFLIFKPVANGADPGTTPAGNDAANGVVANPNTVADAGGAGQDAGGTTGTETPQKQAGAPQDQPRDPQADDTPVTTPMNRPLDDKSGTGGADASAQVPAPVVDADSAADARVNLAQLVDSTRARFESGDVTAAQAKAILNNVQRLRRRRRQQLSPERLADTWFLEMMAHLALEDAKGACTAANQVLRASADSIDRQVARSARSNFCP